MTIFYFLILLAPCGAAIWLAIYKKTKMEYQLVQEAKEQAAMHLQELDIAIDEWLVMLELPALEEQTRGQEVAHRLRTVLIEKLMLQRVLD